MLPKVGASYVLKKVGDYVMTPPSAPAAEPEAQPRTQQQEPTASPAPGIDGQMITDENGANLGVARRVANVGVYLISDSRAGLEEQLKATITDPEGRIFFHHDDSGKLTGLIYVPDPSSRPAPVAATRPDDI
jgi:hypothetical protein